VKKTIYDNSNIVESYAGCTTVLTFSFVRHVYEGVYKHFCRMMGTGENEIKNHSEMFKHMLAFIGFRIYYNLSNWYMMLSFFPGFRFSSRFMEKMMGVEKEHKAGDSDSFGFFQKYFIYLPKTLFLSFKIVWSFSFLGIGVRKFNKYFDKVFSEIQKVDLNKLDFEGLKKLYGKLDKELVAKWKVPIANDFAVMVSAGLADRLFCKWLDSEESYSYMYGIENLKLSTLDPSNRIMKIVEVIKSDKKLYNDFCADSIACASNTKVSGLIQSYIDDFGSRMPNELKLETQTLEENPDLVIKLIKSFLVNRSTYRQNGKNKNSTEQLEKLSFVKRIFMRWLLKWAGNSIHRREDTRFRRSLIFGYARKIFLAMGEIFEKLKIIDQKRDVFYLTLDEILNMDCSKGKQERLIQLIEKRKLEQAQWSKIELPRRIESEKSIKYIEQEIKSTDHISKKTYSGIQLKGRIASKPDGNNILNGVALSLKAFDPNADFNNKILVTKQTDPGWTVVFPLLKGIIVERGGMLSHAAIVARELGIPCLVGVSGATECVENGAEIKMDLSNGFVTVEK